MSRPRVVVLRGHSASPWELGAWERLSDRYDVRVVVTGRNLHALDGVALPTVRVRSLRGLLPRGRLGDLAVHVPGDRYVGLAEALAGADIVHSAEVGTWFAAQPATLKGRLGFRLVLTVWETIPLLETYLDPARAPKHRRARRVTFDATDLYLAATERARRCLLLEGVPRDRVEVCAPGIDTTRFAAARAEPPPHHLVVSPGRLVWEKGHHDVIRALAHLGGDHRLLIVGAGRDHDRLHRYAGSLGVGDRTEIRQVPYAEMPSVFARASAVTLASLTTPIWEEQFGMVLAEAMAARAAIVASRSGAIPEVLDGSRATLFDAGDWAGLAGLLAAGPLAGEPGARVDHDPALVERYSTEQAAERLAAAYERVLA